MARRRGTLFLQNSAVDTLVLTAELCMLLHSTCSTVGPRGCCILLLLGASPSTWIAGALLELVFHPSRVVHSVSLDAHQ